MRTATGMQTKMAPSTSVIRFRLRPRLKVGEDRTRLRRMRLTFLAIPVFYARGRRDCNCPRKGRTLGLGRLFGLAHNRYFFDCVHDFLAQTTAPDITSEQH